MYLECKKCNSPDIEVTSPYDNYPFYCNICEQFLKHDEVKEYKAVSNSYASQSFTQLLVLKDK